MSDTMPISSLTTHLTDISVSLEETIQSATSLGKMIVNLGKNVSRLSEELRAMAVTVSSLQENGSDTPT